jgi:hypothetical protein
MLVLECAHTVFIHVDINKEISKSVQNVSSYVFIYFISWPFKEGYREEMESVGLQPNLHIPA